MQWFRPAIREMSGYVPGEQPRLAKLIKLNTNENPYPPSPAVTAALQRFAVDRLRKYPDPHATEFREAVAHLFEVTPDAVLACNGSDEGLTLLTRATLDADDLMRSPTPSYVLYKVLAQIQGCQYEECPFDEQGQLPGDYAAQARLAFLPNPNSPTGTAMTLAQMETLIQQAAGLFVSDEAYADFHFCTAISLLAKYPQLVVSRTLSKSHGLAGLRLGYLVADPAVIAQIRKAKDSYNCDALSIALGTAALLDQEYFAQTRDRILKTRRRLELALLEFGFTVTPPQANFVWCRHSRPVAPIFQSLRERGILVRYFNYPNYGEGLRISVGTDEEIDAFLEALRELL